MISHWRHILTRQTVQQSMNLSKSFRSKHSVHTQRSAHSLHEMDAVEVIPGAYTGTDKKIETVISAGSTLAEESREESLDEEPVSLIQHMARMGRRGSSNESPAHDRNSNVVTIKKEVYIREERTGDPQEKV